MSSLGSALAALFGANDVMLLHARVVAGLAACRARKMYVVTDAETGHTSYQFRIDLAGPEELRQFSMAIEGVIEANGGE